MVRVSPQPIRPNLKPFLIGQHQQKSLFLPEKYDTSCQFHIQAEKAESVPEMPEHIQGDHLIIFNGRKSIFGKKLLLGQLLKHKSNEKISHTV